MTRFPEYHLQTTVYRRTHHSRECFSFEIIIGCEVMCAIRCLKWFAHHFQYVTIKKGLTEDWLLTS